MVIESFLIKEHIGQAMFGVTFNEKINGLVLLSKNKEPEIGCLLQILLKENQLGH